jgi:hypothetical protein
MRWGTVLFAAIVGIGLAPAPATAQPAATPLYRVFLQDGTSLTSFGEWARIDRHLVFSMPLGPAVDSSDLHLMTVPIDRVDLPRTERYANAVRAANYAAARGEADFARLSSDVAQTLNQIAYLSDPLERVAVAERARRALADFPAIHHGYRSAEVREILGVLDDAIVSLRTAAGQAPFDIALSAMTTEAEMEPLLPSPDGREIIEQLMSASAVVASPTEKLSLLQSVVRMLDRAVDLLPVSIAATIRSRAVGAIAEEQRIDAAYARLRTTTLAEASKHADRADVRRLEALRQRVRAEDAKLGARRPDDTAAVLATVEAHVESAHQLRLMHDQWLLRIDRVRAYQRATHAPVQALTESEASLDDIRMLAGPSPQRLRALAQQLSRGARRLALVDPPADLIAVHEVFLSAYALAENAVQLRLDAAAAADVDLAKQASAAATGCLMLLGHARADLASAVRPPRGARPAVQP